MGIAAADRPQPLAMLQGDHAGAKRRPLMFADGPAGGEAERGVERQAGLRCVQQDPPRRQAGEDAFGQFAAEALALRRGDNGHQAHRRPVRPVGPAHRGADQRAVALGGDAVPDGMHERPVLDPVRPAEAR